jgi:hypothetical protein
MPLSAATTGSGTKRRQDMTNYVAAWLAALIVAGVLADMVLNEGAVVFFLALKFAGLLDWMAFWR